MFLWGLPKSLPIGSYIKNKNNQIEKSCNKMFICMYVYVYMYRICGYPKNLYLRN